MALIESHEHVLQCERCHQFVASDGECWNCFMSDHSVPDDECLGVIAWMLLAVAVGIAVTWWLS